MTAVSPSYFLLHTSSPPSDRDLEIYESVCIARHSLRAAAELHNLSVTRIRQLVKRVTDWLAETLPPETDASREKQLQLARHIAADQIQYAQCELMDLWRQTQNPSYLLKTTRLSLAAARLGVVPGTIDGLIADALEEAQAAETPDPFQATPTTEAHSEFCILNSEFPQPPPTGDCAPSPASPALTIPDTLHMPATNHLTPHDLPTQHSTQQIAQTAVNTPLRAPRNATDSYLLSETTQTALR
jgi:hypothetical protein